MVSLEEIVCEPLVSQPVAKRPAYVPGLIERALQEYATGPVLCTDTDVLFDPSLQLDPLSFFKRTSRFLSLVITWAGAFEHGKLSYAVPGHAHYRTWPTPDLCTDCIIQLDAFHN
jgi:hypothetical protein